MLTNSRDHPVNTGQEKGRDQHANGTKDRTRNDTGTANADMMFIQTIGSDDFISKAAITQNNQFMLNWDDLVQLLSVHKITMNKKDVRLFACSEFDFSGNNAVKRDLNNIIKYDALVLDFDHCKDMAKYRYHLRKFTHLGYTSHSHCPSDHNFRAVMKVSRPFTNDEFAEFKCVVENTIFPHIPPKTGDPEILDPTCLHRNHWYYMPSAPSAIHTEAWSATGKVMDIDAMLIAGAAFKAQVAAQAAALAMRQAALHSHQFSQSSPSDDRKRIMSYFKSHQPFVGYEPIWAAVCATMKALGFTLYDFQAVTAIIMDQKSAADAQQKWAGASPISNPKFGYLTNVAKGKHNRFTQS